MEASLFSTSFVQLEKAQQGVVQALELAADTVDELAKGSEAQQSILEQKCRAFLEEVQAVQSTLVAVGPSSATHRPYQGRSYLSQLDASLLHKQVAVASSQLQPEAHQTSVQKLTS